MLIKRTTNIYTLLTLLMSLSATADDSVLNITGRLISPPLCYVNNNEIIVVDFYQVNSSYIRDEKYRKDINFNIQCDGKQNNWKMYLVLDSENKENNQISTNINNLFIKFKLDGIDLEIGKKYLINPNLHIKLEAILTSNKRPISKLGDFESSASIIVEYE